MLFGASERAREEWSGDMHRMSQQPLNEVLISILFQVAESVM